MERGSCLKEGCDMPGVSHAAFSARAVQVEVCGLWVLEIPVWSL